MAVEPTTILSNMLEPLGNLTPQAASEFAELTIPTSVQDRVGALADKNNDGTITEEERGEYETLVKYGNMLSVIKAKAKKVVTENS